MIKQSVQNSVTLFCAMAPAPHPLHCLCNLGPSRHLRMGPPLFRPHDGSLVPETAAGKNLTIGHVIGRIGIFIVAGGPGEHLPNRTRRN